jgi:hypothetical protein
MSGQLQPPAVFLRERTPLYTKQGAGLAQCLSGHFGEGPITCPWRNSTVHPVESRYTDYHPCCQWRRNNIFYFIFCFILLVYFYIYFIFYFIILSYFILLFYFIYFILFILFYFIYFILFYLFYFISLIDGSYRSHRPTPTSHPPKCGSRSPYSSPPLAHVNNTYQINSSVPNHFVYPELRTTSTHIPCTREI